LNGSVRRRKSGRRASEKSEGQAQAKARSKLIDTEDAASGAVPWSVYVAYFRSMGFWFAIGAVLCNIAQQTASVYSNSKLALFQMNQYVSLFFIAVWLSDWSSDLRILVDGDTRVQNIYMGVYGAFGVVQGKRKLDES